MNKVYIVLFIIVATLYSCENDDICIESTTPQLIIRFYDAANPTTKKKVNSLNVWIAEKDSIVKNMATDSIAIPLNTNSTNTVYKFSSTNKVDDISFTYQPGEVYISRSCGFKAIFQNVTATKTTSNWIQQIIIKNPTIENEKNAHITILH